MREIWSSIVDWFHDLWGDPEPVIAKARKLHLIIGPIVEITGPTSASGCRHLPRKLRRSDMSLVLTDSQKARLKIQPKTKAGNPATVDGVVVWASSDVSIAKVVTDDTDPTGQTAWVTATGLGTAQIQAVADADLGLGVKNITAVLDIEVKAGEAVSVGVVVEAPVEQEDAPAPAPVPDPEPTPDPVP